MLLKSYLYTLIFLVTSFNPQPNKATYYEDGLKAKEDGNVELALEIWEEAITTISDPDQIDPRIGIAYIETVAEEGATSRYEKASEAYFWGITTNKISEYDDLFFFELERIRPLMGGKQYREMHKLLKDGDLEFIKKLRTFWISHDVNPANEYNERLLEHFYRLAELRNFGKKDWDFNTIYKKDHRARIFLKYGEPDFKREGRFIYNSLKIRSLIQQRVSEIVDPSNLGDPNSQLSRQIINNIEFRCQQLHNNSDYEIWVYYNESQFADRAVYIFESENGGVSFSRRGSIGDFIPANAYSMGLRNQNFSITNISGSQTQNFAGGSSEDGDQSGGGVDFSGVNNAPANLANLSNNITPAVLLQMMYYEQLSAVDDFFGITYNRMASRFLDYGTGLSVSLALENRNSNRGELLRWQSEMPQEISEYDKKINSIELNVYPYRFLNEYNKPVTLFFVRSNPFVSLINNFQVNRESYSEMRENDQGLQLAYNHYLQVYDKDWNLKYRLHSSPEINTQVMSKNFKVGTLFSIPYQPDEEIIISSELNNDLSTGSGLENDFDPDLIAMGKAERKHLKPLSSNEFDASDIVIGYNIRNNSDYQFPFIISHEKEIPVNQNLAVYYEIYNTMYDNAEDKSSISVEYEIKTKRPKLIGAIFGKTKTNTTLRISKDSNDRMFKELIEIESEKLKPGKYILELRIRDRVANKVITKELDFKVVS